jgi:transposase InsO family protein
MISAPDRQRAVTLIDEARSAGARLKPACGVLQISARTYQRWTTDGTVRADGRPEAERPRPAHALSPEECDAVIAVCNRPENADRPPTQIVPKLADEGEYIASESTFYRILRRVGQQHHRGRAKSPRKSRPPSSHTATAPNQIWCWDITWLAGPIRGQFYFLYLILDLYSRKIVGWEVHADESAVHARDLAERTVWREKVVGKPLVLHGDNGSSLKGWTVRALLARLGITRSFSRPRVSDDNAFIEALFRTCKYVPGFPRNGFESLEAARAWVAEFVDFYNHRHHHRGIQFVTPDQRHRGEDHAILAKRHEVYQAAKARNPRRWTSKTRNWNPVIQVDLNPISDRRRNQQAA